MGTPLTSEEMAMTRRKTRGTKNREINPNTRLYRFNDFNDIKNIQGEDKQEKQGTSKTEPRTKRSLPKSKKKTNVQDSNWWPQKQGARTSTTGRNNVFPNFINPSETRSYINPLCFRNAETWSSTFS